MGQDSFCILYRAFHDQKGTGSTGSHPSSPLSKKSPPLYAPFTPCNFLHTRLFLAILYFLYLFNISCAVQDVILRYRISCTFLTILIYLNRKTRSHPLEGAYTGRR